MRLGRVIWSDFLKMKRTPILYIHIILPCVGIIVFSLFAALSDIDTTSKAAGYFQVMGFTFPIIIGTVCAMVCEQEFKAGNGYNLLTSVSSKILNGISKLLILAMLGFISTIVAIFGFGIMLCFILRKDIFSFGFYFKATNILFASNFALYILHLFFSLRFGKNTSIGFGIVGSLVSALLVSSLGAGLWYFVPYAWGSQFASIWTAISADKSLVSSYQSDIALGITFSAALTTIILLVYMLWFSHWEGKKAHD